ncbi:endophilin-B1-like isoform X1 [Petromyzon marinus]|uniref:Endophilin-B1 n=1 Tax=Petromyzon marinus TaxID=7757 RepID=S4RTJ6_PETMA|nr:endophilin-B2-like isoform X1 [Petromyzon marinus]
MDFNVRKLASDAGTFFSRAVQFTEEKLGQAERTELDAHFENLLGRAEMTRHWTDKIMRQAETLLQPNPNARIEDYFFEKLEGKAPLRATNSEYLGQYMIEAGQEFGPGTAYGCALIKCGTTQKELGISEKDFIQTTANGFLTPLRNFLDGDFRTIAKEKKILENKRLDLDACKSRLKKARSAEAKAATEPDFNEIRPRNYVLSASAAGLWADEVARAEQELRVTQTEFDRQAEITRLLLEGIGSTHANHHRALKEFVEAQAAYYAKCYQSMVELQKELGSFPTSFVSNNNLAGAAGSGAASAGTGGGGSAPPVPTPSILGLPSAEGAPPLVTGTRRARVLYDYDAADMSELSLLADEVVTVYSLPGMDSDWLMGERGNQKGKVPVTYLELLN